LTEVPVRNAGVRKRSRRGPEVGRKKRTEGGFNTKGPKKAEEND